MTKETSRDSRWNFLVLMGDYISFGTGMSFVSQVTILPAFVKNFTDSTLVVGLVTSIWILGFSIPQILAASHIEGLSRVKPYILKVGAGERIPWVAVALLVLFAGSAKSLWILPAFFLLYIVITSSGGLMSPAWMDLVARVVSQHAKGKFFGFAYSMSTAVGALGGLAAGFLLDTYGFPDGFAFCFLATFLLTSLSWGFMVLIREPERKPGKVETDLKAYLRHLSIVLREDREFSLFIASQILFGFLGMATAFYTAYAIDLLHPTGEQIGVFTFVFLGSQVFANILWGYLGDRKGHKLAMQLGYACGIAAALVAAYAESVLSFYLVFVLAGAGFSASIVSRLSMLLEFAGTENRPTYLAVSSALISPFAAIAPLVGGVLAGLYRHPPVFFAAAVITGMGFLLLTIIQDPRSRLTTERRTST